MNGILEGDWSPGLDEAEQHTLLALARDTLVWLVADDVPPLDMMRYRLSDGLRTAYATFATLKAGVALRGCIGTLTASEPLYRSVHHNTIQAGSRDPRFPPVTAAELDGIRLHLSILSPMVPIDDLVQFKIGTHGIVLEKAGERAVFLPEVAAEQGWTAEETAEFLCAKAGLRARAWREDASFKVFTSFCLHEPAAPPDAGDHRTEAT